MEQLEGTTTKPQKKYKVRAGTIDSGKKYEYKMAALLSLRCVLHKEDSWLLSNADGVGAFDDIILRQGNKTFMIQLKHKDDPKALVEREFLGPKIEVSSKHNNKCENEDTSGKQQVDGVAKKGKKGDFFLNKYLEDIGKLKDPKAPKTKIPDVINLNNFEDISFVLFTNRSTKSCTFLEETCDIPSLFQTGQKEHKINIDKVPCLPNGDYYDVNLYLLSEQIHAKYIDGKIQEEMQKVADHFKIEQIIINKQMVETFTKHVTDWAEGALGGHYCLTKFDIVTKITELFYSQYEIKLNPWNFQPRNEKQIWCEIVQDKILTIIEFEDSVLTFLLEYISTAVNKYCDECKNWNDKFSDDNQRAFYKNNPDLNADMLRIIGNHGKITPLDVYKCLWINKKLPVILQIVDLQQYNDILRILELTNYNYKVIIMHKLREALQEPTIRNVKYFKALNDLNEEETKKIILQEVNLQGRTQATLLGTVIDQNMYNYIKCKDIINILSGEFNIGNNLNPLPDYFVSRSISKVFLQMEVLGSAQDEIFLIEATPEQSYEMAKIYSNSVKMENIDFNKLNRGGIIFFTRTPTREEIERLTSVKKHTHHLSIHNADLLEWKASFGSVRNLRKFEIPSENITESCIINKFSSPIIIINAVPGMGKSVLMDYVAQHTPTNKWVLKIDLNKYRAYYKTNACKSPNTKASEHLDYFKNALLVENLKQNEELNNAVFQTLSNKKDVIVLLDGFDEISVLYKTQVTNIAKSLRKGGYSVWLTTRPYMTSHLEEEFDTFAITLTSFSVKNQKDFLTEYFYTQHINTKYNSKTLIESFVQKLLNAAVKNLTDWDAEFTGVPLQTKLLADAFKVDCANYISSEGSCYFNEDFDLIYLYQTFINSKIEILNEKFGQGAEDNRSITQDHQSCFALMLLFPQYENLLIFQSITEEYKDYYRDKPDRLELLQQEGVVTVDKDFSVNFIHRTYAEYLAAIWLAENLTSSKTDKKELACILIKSRFTQDYKFLFGIFDRSLSQGFPLHLAIINNKEEEIEKIKNTKLEEITKKDKGGRSILHILALYSQPFPQLFIELCYPYVLNHNAVKFLNSKQLNTIKSSIVLEVEKILRNYTSSYFLGNDLLGYNPLDYALANQSLSVAYNIVEAHSSLAINASISLRLKTTYLVYSAILNYRSLFNALLPYFLSKDLLYANIDRRDSVESYIRNAFRVSNSSYVSNLENTNIKEKIEAFQGNFISKHKYKTVLELLHPVSGTKWKLNNTDYSDIRYAICFGSKDNINRLLRFSMINQQDTDYNTSLHYAVLHRLPKVVDTILSKDPVIDKQNVEMNTPLHLAFSNMITENTMMSFLENNKRHRIVKKLIEAKADTNVKNKQNVSPLHLAVENRKCDWLKMFLSRDGDVNIQDGKGNNSLHLAAVNDFHDILHIILNNSRNIQLDMQNNDGETPLFCTVRNNNITTLKLLLKKGASVNVQNMYGETILHLICVNGYNQALREVLKSNNPIDISIVDNYGFTPFFSALFNNKLETVTILRDNNANLSGLNEKGKLILDFAVNNQLKNYLNTALVTGANIDINRQDKNGRTPLFNAVKNGELDKALQLLRLEARLDSQDINGLTVLHLLASTEGIQFNDTIISILNKNFNKIDGNIQDNNGRTPLFYAIENNQKDTAQLFLSHGADVHIRDKNGTSSLHLMASRGYNNILTDLLANGNIDINIQDNNGRTPLYYAIQENNKHTAKLFLSNDADVNIQDKNGTSSLHLIASRGYIDVYTAISKSREIKINMQDNEGRSPLYCALQENNKSMAQAFILGKADFNLRDKNGICSLHLIAGNGYEDILDILITNSANIDYDIEDNTGRTPLFYASLNNQEKAIITLLEHGANITPDIEGKTACDVAADLGCKQILGLYSILKNCK